MKNTCKKAAKIQVSDEATRLASAGSQGKRDCGFPGYTMAHSQPFSGRSMAKKGWFFAQLGNHGRFGTTSHKSVMSLALFGVGRELRLVDMRSVTKACWD